MSTATVRLWGTAIGYVSMDANEDFARFEYDPDFAERGIELAPVHMPAVPRRIYRFEELHPRTFHGLPGMLADSLPDRYGHQLIDVWLASKGRSAEDFNAVDRLCYTGTRGMGALEFEPAMGEVAPAGRELRVEELVQLASLAFTNKEQLRTRLGAIGDDQALLDILQVGTSAGGARAKAVVAWNPATQEIRSGQLPLPDGFEPWLMKFDGVEFNGDWGIADPQGYGLLEYSYSLLAKEAGLTMSECRVLSENGRNHFMTRRFDRDDRGGKRFVQTLGALAHYDYYESGAHSYEQVILLMRKLDMPQTSIEEFYRRAVFNLVGCNQDDHVKNFGFTMDRRGRWDLAPAYDLCHSQGPGFTRHHQLSVNGKLDHFERADLQALADYAALPQGRGLRILDQVREVFAGWQPLAQDLGVPQPIQDHVMRTLRLDW